MLKLRAGMVAMGLGGVIFAGGCAAQKYDDPVPLMTNTTVVDKTRMAAAEQAEREMPNDPRRIAALYELTWIKGVEDEERVYAFHQLEKYDGANFRKKIALQVPSMVDWVTISAVFDMAVKNGWKEFTPVVVQQYARIGRGVEVTQRPEREYLKNLNPGKTPEEVIWEVFANAGQEWTSAQQVAAWELLCKLYPRKELMAKLVNVQPKSALVADLKASARDLGTVPVNKEGVLWLMYWTGQNFSNSPKGLWTDDFWGRATVVCQSLTAEQKEGLEIRHIPVLMRAAKSASFKMGKAELYAKVVSLIPDAGHYTVSPSYDGQPPDYPQKISEYAKQLSWGDLYVIYVAISVLQNQPAVSAQVFDLIDKDVADTSTEYGGVMVWKDSDTSVPIEKQPLEVRYVAPARRDHDRKYVSSDDLVTQAYTGFAHFHLHAQYYNNTDWAGPGRGDLDFADRLGFNCLLFTSIKKGVFNADYYQTGRVVVDLGSVGR
jgi:hypothetical protein